MATEPSIEEIVERAKRVQEDRIMAIRAVAETRQKLADVRTETARELAEVQVRIAERVAEAERADIRAYNASLSAGWSPEELHKIGFNEPEKKARARRRTARNAPPRSRDADHAPQVQDEGAPGPENDAAEGDENHQG